MIRNRESAETEGEESVSLALDMDFMGKRLQSYSERLVPAVT